MENNELGVSSPGDVLANFEEHQEERVVKAAGLMIKDVEDFLLGNHLIYSRRAKAWAPGQSVKVRLNKIDSNKGMHIRACEYVANLYRKNGWSAARVESQGASTFLVMEMPGAQDA